MGTLDGYTLQVVEVDGATGVDAEVDLDEVRAFGYDERHTEELPTFSHCDRWGDVADVGVRHADQRRGPDAVLARLRCGAYPAFYHEREPVDTVGGGLRVAEGQP